MTTELLDRLRSAEFQRRVGALLPAPALRRVLSRNDDVKAIAEALTTGTLTDENVEEFVASILAELRAREPLEHELAVAAITVALEGSQSEFATRFLTDLAALSIVELQLSRLVARECLRHRKPPARTFNKRFKVAATLPRRLHVQTFVDTGERVVPANTFFAVPTEGHGAA